MKGLTTELNAQNIGIGDQADFVPDPSAILELKTIQRGFLMPRMTYAQKMTITSPAHGLLVIQTDNFATIPVGLILQVVY